MAYLWQHQGLSLREIQSILDKRGLKLSHEFIRQGIIKIAISLNPFDKFLKIKLSNIRRKRKENSNNSHLRYPEKEKARRILRRAIKSGKIIKLPCEICKNPNSQGHHSDYFKPLEVKWLCIKHHLKTHRLLDNGKLFATIKEIKSRRSGATGKINK